MPKKSQNDLIGTASQQPELEPAAAPIESLGCGDQSSIRHSE
jgi:hypothetical protein